MTAKLVASVKQMCFHVFVHERSREESYQVRGGAWSHGWGASGDDSTWAPAMIPITA